MAKYRVAAGPRNRLDFCAHCEDVWLDGGEWELVETLVAAGKFTRIFTQPWQRKIREDISENMQTERMKKLLGEDYRKFTDFREWLDAHPQRDDLVALLVHRGH